MLNIKNDKYAIIVGRGDLAKGIVEKAKTKGLDFVIAGIYGISPSMVVNYHDNFWFKLGEVAFLLDKLKKNKVTKVILVGSMIRPSLLSLKLDDLGKQIVAKYIKNVAGDNSLLSMVIEVIENYGFKVVGAHDIDDSIFAQKKVYTNISPSSEKMEEIYKCFDLSKKLSIFDIGQSIIFQQNMVLSVEAAEGTAKLISRSKSLIKKNYYSSLLHYLFLFLIKLNINYFKSFLQPNGYFYNSKDYDSGAFLLKIKKQNQDIRVDMPTIGDKTIIQAKKAGLVGVVIEAGSTIILNEKKTVDLANKYGLFLIAI